MRPFAVLSLAAAAFTAQAQQIQVSPANRTIAVTATEQAERRADTATVHVGYQIYGAASEQVTQEAGKRSKAITDALANAGVPEGAVESEGQGTGPVQEYQNGPNVEDRANRRFQAQQGWTVRVPAAAASGVLAAAVSAGANQSGAVDWSIADEDGLTAEAAGKALKHAQAVAEQMAAGLGGKLGPLVYASNQAQQAESPINGRAYQFNGPPSASPSAQAVKLSVSPQTVRRSATVYAVFSLQ